MNYSNNNYTSSKNVCLKQTFHFFSWQQCNALGYKFDGKINNWDMRYYMTMVEEKNYTVDHEKLKEYFPLDVVTKGDENNIKLLISLIMCHFQLMCMFLKIVCI